MLVRLRVRTHELDEIISFDLHDALIFELSKVNVNVQEVIPANKHRQRKLALQNKHKAKTVSPANKQKAKKVIPANKHKAKKVSPAK